MSPNPPLPVPEFRPTADEFADFGAFVARIERLCPAGAATVRPPRGWRPRTNLTYDDIDDMVVRRPIRQEVLGSKGVFVAMHIVQPKRTVREFREEATKFAQRCRAPSLCFRESSQQKPTAPAASPSGLTAVGSPERCSAASPGPVPTEDSLVKLDTVFSKNILFRRPMYGADMKGTLFEDSVCKDWNLNHLGTILDMFPPMSGVNDPYLYFGMFGSLFCFHVEDADLYGINYLHVGAPKTWYTIPVAHRARFESLCQRLYPSHFDACKEFMRHKQGLISLDVLRKHGIPFGRVTQLEGTFTIVFPGVYHSGFNHGFNVAEAINFASLRWLHFAKNVSACTCRKDTVKLDVEAVDRKLFPGKYTPEFAARSAQIASAIEQIRRAKRIKILSQESRILVSARGDGTQIGSLARGDVGTGCLAPEKDGIDSPSRDQIAVYSLAANENTTTHDIDTQGTELTTKNEDGTQAAGSIRVGSQTSHFGNVGDAREGFAEYPEPAPALSEPTKGSTHDSQPRIESGTPKRRRSWAPIQMQKMADLAICSNVTGSARQRARLERATMCGIEMQMLAASALLNTTSVVLRDVADQRRLAALGKRMSRTRRRYVAVQACMFEPCTPGMGHTDDAPRLPTAETNPRVPRFIISLVNSLVSRATRLRTPRRRLRNPKALRQRILNAVSSADVAHSVSALEPVTVISGRAAADHNACGGRDTAVQPQPRQVDLPCNESKAIPLASSVRTCDPESSHHMQKHCDRPDDSTSVQVRGLCEEETRGDWLPGSAFSSCTLSGRVDMESSNLDINEFRDWACDGAALANDGGHANGILEMELLADEKSIDLSNEYSPVAGGLLPGENNFNDAYMAI